MGIVLKHTDVEDVFGRFSEKMSHTNQKGHTILAGEDPNEVLLEVAFQIVEDRSGTHTNDFTYPSLSHTHDTYTLALFLHTM
jgi:hypothetical protein